MQQGQTLQELKIPPFDAGPSQDQSNNPNDLYIVCWGQAHSGVKLQSQRMQAHVLPRIIALYSPMQ